MILGPSNHGECERKPTLHDDYPDERPAIPKMYREQRSPRNDDEDDRDNAYSGSPGGDSKHFDSKLTAPYQNDYDLPERGDQRNHNDTAARHRSSSRDLKPFLRDKDNNFTENSPRRLSSSGRPASPRQPSPPGCPSSPQSVSRRSRSPHERKKSPASRDRTPNARGRSPPRSRTRSPHRSPSFYGRSRSPFNRFPPEPRLVESPKDISDEIQEEMRRQKRKAEEDRRREERRKRHQKREENEQREAERKRREEYVFLSWFYNSHISREKNPMILALI